MKRIKLEKWDGAEYSSTTVSNWVKGEEREVDDGLADYLLKTFPGCFVDPAAKPKAEKPKA